MKRTLTRLPGLLFIWSIFIFDLAVYSPAKAQDDGQEAPYYIVQEGDSLWQIASRFKVRLEDLQQANNISEASQVAIGTRLVIPGLDGVSGPIETIAVPYGETLRSLSRRYGIPELALARLNRLITPTELYAGVTLIVPATESNSGSAGGRMSLAAGQSLLELAVLQDQDPWSIVLVNNLPGQWSSLPGDVLTGRVVSQSAVPSGLPLQITQVEMDPLQLVQGGTAVIKVFGAEDLQLRGTLGDRNLNFFPQEYGYVALQGIHALFTPGLYPLTLEGTLPSGKSFAFSQNVVVQDAGFSFDPSLEVDPATVDPAITKPEADLWASLGVPVTHEKMWEGPFASPVPADFRNCWTSLFGTRRSYNGGPYDSFHSGLDFCGQVGTELYAVAPGKVVYTGTLVVRGGVVVIDHGWGVYTAYDHLSRILVEPGDAVQSGQVMGLGGDTGRTTGPHLHWEVWVSGVQVNPVDWLNRSYP